MEDPMFMGDPNKYDDEVGDVVSCAACGQLPNDVLILTCDHNLCLRCASLNLQRENRKNNQQISHGGGTLI